MVSHILYSTLLRDIGSKVNPSFVEDINMAAGFGDVRQYVERLTFMYMCQVTSKIRLDVLFGGGGGFMKNVAVMFQGSFRSSYQRCSALESLLNPLKLLRTPMLKNICEQLVLLLEVHYQSFYQ